LLSKGKLKIKKIMEEKEINIEELLKKAENEQETKAP
jgi:hypothetical protein